MRCRELSVSETTVRRRSVPAASKRTLVAFNLAIPRIQGVFAAAGGGFRCAKRRVSVQKNITEDYLRFRAVSGGNVVIDSDEKVLAIRKPRLTFRYVGT